MNSCILMAQIIQDPELRYTADNQTPLAQMLVQFPGLGSEDTPTTLKVIGWGNFASEIKENYAAGDRIVIEGRLGMNTIDRPEGFKEKRAELTAYRIHKLGVETNWYSPTSGSKSTFDSPISASSTNTNNVVVPLRNNTSSTPVSNTSNLERDFASNSTESSFEPSIVPTPTSTNPESQPDLDDIPF
ncbi:MAG: single-stranded DNA-binding protein [Symploca sp. SIO1A3]|nr:single-stranded DNA-binding protein [Symploca sp. SIO2C1]NER49216.1 single-stranded DNA-binding protein [Symploca sp. SIO1A3]